MYYTGKEKKACYFSTMSESLEHGPAVIWTHLDPVLNAIKTNHAQIDTLHFFSDGPSTQYREKGTFFSFLKEHDR